MVEKIGPELVHLGNPCIYCLKEHDGSNEEACPVRLRAKEEAENRITKAKNLEKVTND